MSFKRGLVGSSRGTLLGLKDKEEGGISGPGCPVLVFNTAIGIPLLLAEGVCNKVNGK